MSIATAVVVLGAAAVGFLFGGGISLGSDTTAPVSVNSSGADISTDRSIAIPGFNKLVMKAGQLDQTVDLFNPEGNNCYMTIELLLPDRTSIYKTGLMEPGTKIKQIKISCNLKAGNYDGAIMKYSNFDRENMQELNGAETIFNLEVMP